MDLNDREYGDEVGGVGRLTEDLVEPRDEVSLELLRRRGREVIQLHLRVLRERDRRRRNLMLDVAETERRLQFPESELDYVGRAGDYADGPELQTVLRNLAAVDGDRRGAPPAAKAAVEGLENVVVEKVADCAICKDLVNVSEIVKKLPCGHIYHDGCINPWLWSRNSCPLCRFELPTDDPEYEKQRKKRRVQPDTSSTSVVDSSLNRIGD